MRALIVIACVIVVAAIVASFISLPYYALTPGSAQPVEPLIAVPASMQRHHRGSIDLVDVHVTPVRAIDWIFFELDSSATLLPSTEILGFETPAQYNTEGVLDMADAQQAATVVALHQLGYHPEVRPSGALLYALLPGSPAERSLVVGDVVAAVGRVPVTSAAGLATDLQSKAVGEEVVLSVRQYGHSGLHRVTLRLGSWRWQGSPDHSGITCLPSGSRSRDKVALLVERAGQLAIPAKGQTGRAIACLGVYQVEDAFTISRLPFKVDLSSEGIVGPSAGLAFTLGLMQKLDRRDLTGGLKVACTGTMDIHGNVGAIGGIEQKTIAVNASGAAVFLVPRDNYKTAKAFAGPRLKVYAVSKISQVIGILKRLGGRISR
ncbi:MAG: S16 family serine protease [Acidimicrobiales bacterium]